MSLSSLIPKPKKDVQPVEKSDAPVSESTELISQEEATKRTQLVKPNTIPKEYDAQGNLRYDVLAKVGHSSSRVLQTSLTDMLPTEQQVWVKPPAEEIAQQLEKTREALEKVLAGKIKAAQPKNLEVASAKDSSTFVKFTSADSKGEQKIVRLVEAQKDPFDPPKFHHKRIPRPPPSPPAPVLHSPPRKVTKDEQEAWKIPPCISNWKNKKGYTIPLDKRLAADGRGLIENTINPKFASVAETLYLAEQHARVEVEKRAAVEQKLAEQRKRQTEETLRQLAEEARREKKLIAEELARETRREEGHSYEMAGSGLTLQEREQIRQEKARQLERDLRLSRMSAEQRSKFLAREQDRDISERIALGQAAPSAAGQESLYDQRLFDQTSGISAGFGDEDSYSLYSKPLFGSGSAAAAHLIYKPTFASNMAEEGDEDGQGEFDRAGRPTKTFEGADKAPPRTGPVEFELAPSDPFGLDQMLQEAKNQHEPPSKQRR